VSLSFVSLLALRPFLGWVFPLLFDFFLGVAFADFLSLFSARPLVSTWL